MFSEQSSARVAKIACRIVFMYELYRKSINLKDQAFLEFIENFLKRNNISNPDSISYFELYTLIRSAIRSYIKSVKK